MPKACPWCGKPLETKVIQVGDKIRQVCSKCGWKIKEIDKPKPAPVEQKPEVIEVKPNEIPETKPAPIWPLIVGGVVLIALIILFVKFVLLA